MPVFRYALERWPADSYVLLVLHDKNLTSDETRMIDEMEQGTRGDYQDSLFVRRVDLREEVPKEIETLKSGLDTSSMPVMALMYPPAFQRTEPCWSGVLSDGNITLLLNSDGRRQIVQRIVDGQTIVWVFLGGNDETQNKEALTMLRTELANAEKDLNLPHEVDPEDQEYDMELAEGVDLKIEFSVLEIDRNDPSEKILMASLQPFLDQYEEKHGAVVVPVFGRGRALTALAGEEMSAESVAKACYFLTGPCSCQVKDLNPGADICIPVDWDGLITGIITVDDAMPELVVPQLPPTTPDRAPIQKMEHSNRVTRNLVIMAMTGLIVLVILTSLVLKSPPKDPK